MTTLIAVYDNDGCKGRCDARCYEAREPHCDCVCGGRNHGAVPLRTPENLQMDGSKLTPNNTISKHLAGKCLPWHPSSLTFSRL